MTGLKDLSIRCSGFVTEAQLRKSLSQVELAQLLEISDRTLRDKSNQKEMYTLSLGQVALLADLAGYEIDFKKVAG